MTITLDKVERVPAGSGTTMRAFTMTGIGETALVEKPIPVPEA